MSLKQVTLRNESKIKVNHCRKKCSVVSFNYNDHDHDDDDEGDDKGKNVH